MVQPSMIILQLKVSSQKTGKHLAPLKDFIATIWTKIKEGIFQLFLKPKCNLLHGKRKSAWYIAMRSNT